MVDFFEFFPVRWAFILVHQLFPSSEPCRRLFAALLFRFLQELFIEVKDCLRDDRDCNDQTREKSYNQQKRFFLDAMPGGGLGRAAPKFRTIYASDFSDLLQHNPGHPGRKLAKITVVFGHVRLCGIVSSVFPYIKPAKNGFAAAQKSFLLAVGEPFFTGYST